MVKDNSIGKGNVTAIDKLDWFSAREEGLGDLYEGLLAKNADEKKSGAGQYFTPRPLIDAIIRLVKPQAGEVIQDPAAGTGGFLVAADRYIKEQTNDFYTLSQAENHFQHHQAFTGLELVPDTHRLCLMNLILHGIESGVSCGDSLSPDGETLGRADVMLTNPPFGTKKGGGKPTRSDFSVTADTSIDTPRPEGTRILGSTKPLRLDTLQCLTQSWDSPQALLRVCPTLVGLLQVLFDLACLADQNAVLSSSSKYFTYCEDGS